MGKKLLFLLLFLCMTGGANAAVYNWIGGDGDWDTPANWSTDSASWTWPHEEFGGGDYSNQDTILIDIPAGVNVTRSKGTSIDGMRDGSTTAVLDLSGNLNITGTLWLADWNTTAHGSAIVRNGATLTTTVDVDIANDNNGRLDVEAGGTVNAGDWLLNKAGTASGTWDGQINATNHIRLGYGSGSSNITIGTNADINVGGTFYLADSGGTTIVNMLGGTVDTARIIVGDDGGSGTWTMEDGAITNTGNLHVAWVAGVDGTYTQNDGTSVHGGTIYMGNATDALPIINLNDGLLQGEDLTFNATTGVINYGGGQLLINSVNLTEQGMQDLIDNNLIMPSVPYEITTIGNYTALVPEPITMALMGLGSLLVVRRRRR